MYKIKLSSGVILDNLELNGNNYISEKLIDDSVFDEALDIIDIDDGEMVQTHTNMKLIANQIFDGKSWFILAEKTKEEAEKFQLEERIAQLELLLLQQEGVIV